MRSKITALAWSLDLADDDSRLPQIVALPETCENRRLTRLLKAAKIGHDACLEDVRCDPGCGLDKAVLRYLATCRWIDAKLNVIIVGKTGVGKSYLAAASRDFGDVGRVVA